MYLPWTDGIDLSKASQRCGTDDADPKFLAIVQAERLILYGRIETNRRVRIQSGNIKHVDIQNSALIAGEAEFSDVVAFPALRSPSRVDLVSDCSLAEVFDRYLLNDPEVVALSQRAVSLKPELERVFKEGWYTPYGMREWRVDTEFSFLGGFERGLLIGILDDCEPPDAIEALKDRYAALIDMLRKSEIEAYGLPNQSAYPPTIMRSLWSHKDSLVDLRNGDFYFENREAENLRTENQIKLWTGIMLRRSGHIQAPVELEMSPGARDAFHVEPFVNDGVRQEPVGLSPRSKRKSTPEQQSIAAAIASLWPTGFPMGLHVQVRDRMIIEWQKKHGRAVVSSKTINRFLTKRTD